MKYSDIKEAVGRIVKGVNTTVDVGPGEIKKQAAKFGNTVDKDGRPPTLSKKVKGSSTNVLYNLGLAESVAIKLTDLEEALGEIASATEIYVDMDGVLADFFGEWAKLVGKEHWTKIEDVPAALEKIKQTENFWLDLPLTDNAKPLLELIKKVKGEYKILSSPLPGDKNSEPHKREWIKKNLGFFSPADVIITHNKAKYATQSDGTPNILIDDYGVNIGKWEAAGGIGFKHKDHKFERTAKAIKQHMQEPVEEKWSEKYKRSINCSNPKGFSQKAHCAGRNKKESYTREQLPQIRNKHLKNIKHTMEWVKIQDIIPVQKERILENFKRQVDRIVAGKYSPIIVDCDNKIINGHHRYEAARLLGYDEMAVAKLPFTIEQVVENFVKPQLDVEWGEAERYPEFQKIGKEAWIELAKKGKEITITDASDINNTDAADINSFKSLDKNKQKRALAQLEKGSVEMPIVAVYSDGYKELIGGNTRLTAMMAKDGKATVWQFEVPDEVAELAENFADGKKKGKSRPGRVKKAGASCKGSVTSLRKKAKKYSGERGKMYHWCANMKGGKKK